MSTQLGVIEKSGKNDAKLQITAVGGGEKGMMLQLMQGFGGGLNEPGYIQLTKLDAYKVIQELAKWLQVESKKSADELSEMIKKDRALEKMLIQDAVDCQTFIRDLKVLEIPLQLLA